MLACKCGLALTFGNVAILSNSGKLLFGKENRPLCLSCYKKESSQRASKNA